MPQKIKTMRTSNLSTKNWLWQWHPIICRVTKEIKVKKSAQFSSKYGIDMAASFHIVITVNEFWHMLQSDIITIMFTTSFWWTDSPTSQFLLPFHFTEHVFCPFKEVRYFWTLVISLCRVQYFCFCIWCNVFTNLRNRKNNLLQGSVLTNNLQHETIYESWWTLAPLRDFSLSLLIF